MGIGDKTGSLEPGKRADIAVIGLTAPALQPLNDPENAIVYSGSGRDVIATYVDGETIYQNGKVTTVDESQIELKMQAASRSIAGDR